MATEVQKRSAVSRKQLYYKVRPDYYNQAKHMEDNFKNLGYDYSGKILKSMTSPEMWANPLQIPFYSKMEGMINFMIDQVKYVKKYFSIAHDKESIHIN